MSASYKLTVKIGMSEFNADGPEETVKEDYQQFLRAIAAQQPAPAAAATNVGGNGEVLPIENPPAGEITEDDLKRIFLKDEEGYVSLRILPKTGTAGDALMLLLYGYKRLGPENETLALHLTKSAKQSGVALERIDRTIEANEDLYNRGGVKRGTRYALNNRGVLHAEGIIRQMLK